MMPMLSLNLRDFDQFSCFPPLSACDCRFDRRNLSLILLYLSILLNIIICGFNSRFLSRFGRRLSLRFPFLAVSVSLQAFIAVSSYAVSVPSRVFIADSLYAVPLYAVPFSTRILSLAISPECCHCFSSRFPLFAVFLPLQHAVCDGLNPTHGRRGPI